MLLCRLRKKIRFASFIIVHKFYAMLLSRRYCIIFKLICYEINDNFNIPDVLNIAVARFLLPFY